ncbi:MAG: HlyC/CorC family transporter [Clostridia bacterium]|nr:HlyC/CorC family transporter [Clostridia bacterium]
MGSNLTSVIIMAACLVMSAYFSATETAFLSVNKTKLKMMAEKGDKRANLVLKLSDRYNDLISTILIGNNIVNILLSSIGTLLFVRLLGGDIGATVSTAVVTVLVLIFGEISPKNIAKEVPETFAMFSAPIIRVLITVFTPLNFLFGLWKKLIDKLVKVKDKEAMSQEELLMIVDEAQQEGGIDDDESDLIRNAIEFNDLKAEDILTHRVDLEAVPMDISNEEMANTFSASRYSRLLVYNETIDDIVGVIHQKDFYVGTGINPKPIKDIITPPLFIHKTEKIPDLLKLLQKEKSHIAIVIDDYGGTLGIVTMEDILEELVGEIWDEHDEVVENFKQTGENEYILDGAMEFEDFCQLFDMEIETDNLTLSGWIAENLGKIAAVGDHFEYENLSITVTAVDSHRVDKAKVICTPRVIEEEEE